MRLETAVIALACIIAAIILVADFVPENLSTPVVISSAKSDRLPVAATSSCSIETWPNISTFCLKGANREKPISEARRVEAEHG
jgi:hypothetical protein